MVRTAVLNLRFLDKAEEEVVHAQSLECLSTVGALVHAPRVRAMLVNAGALAGPREDLVRFPESLVEEAIRKAPRSFVLGARDPRRDLRLPATGAPYAALGGVTLSITDLDGGTPRPATTKDLEDIARLSDALDPVDAVWPLVTTSDVPAHAQFANELWSCFKNTTKHILGSAGSATLGAADAKTQIALGEIVAGGPEAMRRRPPFSVLSCPIAPLTFERGSVEAQVEYARAGIPVIGMSMCMGGFSAPVTLAGTIVTLNAEALASLVVTQVAAPGAPHIYCSEATMGDMATGYIGYRGPEAPMVFAAAAQMARRYALPRMTGMVGFDAPKPGLDAPFGELVSVLLTAMNGTDLCSGIGGLDLDAGCSLTQIVIDSILWEEARAFLRTFAVDETTAALGVIREVGPGGSFLNHVHTTRNFRSQLFFRDKKAPLYGAAMSDRMVPDACEVVRKTLREHQVDPLDPDLVAKGDAIVREYAEAAPPPL